jgi:uncharacterized protein (TIRG00374 family)
MPRAEALTAVHWWTLPVYLVLWSLVHVLRSARWKLLLNPIADVSMRRVLAASFIGHLAIMLLPLRTGEIVRPLLVREKGRLSTWSALATIVAERLVDGLVLSVLLVAGLALARPLHPLPDQIGDLPISVAVVPRAALVVLLAFNLGIALTIGLYVGRDVVSRWAEGVIGRWFPGVAAWVTERLRLVCAGLRSLTLWRHSIPFVLLTALHWLIAAASGWLLGWGVGFSDFDFARACVVTGVLALGTLVPNAPGFWGAFQFSTYVGLALFTPPEDVLTRGATFVFFSYLFQLLVIVVFALWVMPLGKGWGMALAHRPGLASSASPVTDEALR